MAERIAVAGGGIVHEITLYHALKEGVIAGAGIEPFVVEPAPADMPLFELDNLIVPPHATGAYDRQEAGGGVLVVVALHPQRLPHDGKFAPGTCWVPNQ